MSEVFGERTIASLAELDDWARALWEAASARGRVAILLSGPMGVGKTELSRAIAGHAIGSCEAADDPSSPTFAIHNRYRLGEKLIDHFDLYRIEGEEDLESTGFWDLMAEAGDRLALIEWPERFAWQDLPADWAVWRATLGFASGSAPAARRATLELLRA